MKKIGFITLEKMREELVLLEDKSLEMIKGGYLQKKWSCLFDSLEEIGKEFGSNEDASYYYESFKNDFGYDPGKVVGRNGEHNDPMNPSSNERETIYRKVDGGDFEKALNNFGYYTSETQDCGSVNGRQIVLIPQDNGDYHAVVGESCQNGSISYTDPSSSDKNGSTGCVDMNAPGVRVFTLRESGWNDTGNLDPESGSYY